MPSKDRVGLALGLAITAMGFAGLGSAFYVGPPSSDQLKQISDRETAIARQIGRPLSEDIQDARIYLKPKASDQDLAGFWGDEVTCSRTRRELLVLNDSACGILDTAKAKEEEFQALRARDPALQEVAQVVQFRRAVNTGGFIVGTNGIEFGLVLVGAGLLLKKPGMRNADVS